MSTFISRSPRVRPNSRLTEKRDYLRAGSSSPEILDARTFQNCLRLERKRVERSGRRFVLMLLEPGRLLRDPSKRQAFEQVLTALLRLTRETDLRGWYEEDAIFGVIFTEIADGGCGPILNALLAKIGQALGSVLTLDQINEIKVSFHIFPESGDGNGSGGIPNFVFYRDLLADRDRDSFYHFLKRSIDIAGSLFGLIFLLPLLVAIGIAIRLTSPGPILFRQERVGHLCRKFTFLKFRSMYVNNDHAIHKAYVERLISAGSKTTPKADGSAGVYKITNDPRVTPIGRFLRKTSLDELPQLLNVLRGEMTLVGPRPCIAYEFACYETWHRQRLLAMKPGITGLWQVMGRSRVKFDEMVRLDLEYAKSRSLWLDFKILAQTPRAIFSGAY